MESTSKDALDMHERISVHSICFPGSSLRELFGYWDELGARRVSLSSDLLLEDDGLSAAQGFLGTGDHRVQTITHPFLYGQHLTPRPQSWSGPREKLMRVIHMAQTLGAPSVYMLTGGHGSLTWEEAADNFCEAIAPCAAQARGAGIALMIENAPALYADIHIAHTLRDTVMLAEMAGIGVCIDLFSCWTEAGLRQSIERAMPRCSLVQVADYVYGDRSLPARAVPGDGAIPLQRLLGWIILGAGYPGVFDLELIGPRIDRGGRLTEVRRTAEYVGTMLRSLGA
jgi:sugar phosphate isomerase/epimerase